MIDSDAIDDTIRTYAKHGWILRRVLLTADLRKSLGERSCEFFGDVKIGDGDIDAAWFSRPPDKGEIAWEIRHLNETPFALLEYADETAGDFEDKLREVQSRLAEAIATKK
ncbi:MAG: hypothetical protein WBD16_08360 [Pyrinomonadaceae bacterium]|jgi:hypothetical protein